MATKLFKVQYVNNKGWGKLGYNEASFPAPPTVVGDVSPYVQALSTGVDGKAPDFIRCGAGTECLAMYALLRAGGYKGEFEHNLYTDAFVKPFKDSLVALSHQNPNNSNPGMDKMKASVEKVAPGTKVDSGVLYGYMEADMFISALKKAAAKGKSNITRDAVQKAASTQTWELKGIAGPNKYPASTVAPTPMCREIVKSDGTQWVTVVPYSCNTLRYKVK